MAAYYNEIDPKAAAWLRELIKQGHIADGIVDERSIIDVTPDELRDFTQCHFFAGIGVWSYALRSAGWADDRPVWTGSCPCQPFSAAGARGGFDDERHLWPHWHHLISQCRPPVVFGEQVASKDGLGWLDLVCADMEATGYAIGSADLCAAGIGAPHIRQRLWFVGLADTDRDGCGAGDTIRTNGKERDAEHGGSKIGLADTDGRDASAEGIQREWKHRLQPENGDACLGPHPQRPAEIVDGRRPSPTNGFWRDADWLFCRDSGLADTDSIGTKRQSGDNAEAPRLQAAQREPINSADVSQRNGADHSGRGDVRSDGLSSGAGRPRPTNGFWRDADWLFCRDGKWRPVEPSTSPLAHGAAARVGRLRGYGNAIVAPAAQIFIEETMNIINDQTPIGV